MDEKTVEKMMEKSQNGHAVSVRSLTISEGSYDQLCAIQTAGNCHVRTYNKEEKRLIQCQEAAVIREVCRADETFTAHGTDICLKHALKFTASSTLDEAIERTKKIPYIENVIKLVE